MAVRDSKLARWPDTVIERGYQLWSGPAQGNRVRAAAMLGAEIGDTVSSSTFSQWAREYDWDTRLATEWTDTARIQTERFVDNVWVGSLAGSNYLRSVAEGTAEPDPNRIAAARILVDLAGKFTLKQADQEAKPARKRGRQAGQREALSAGDLATMTSDQLEELERQHRDGQ